MVNLTMTDSSVCISFTGLAYIRYGQAKPIRMET